MFLMINRQNNSNNKNKINKQKQMLMDRIKYKCNNN